MSDGITVDANVMAAFTKSLIHDTTSDERSIVERIRTNHGFVVDEQGQMQNQWFETCGLLLFGEWFIQQLREGTVRKVFAKLDQVHKKRLRNDCRMPPKREMFYVSVAAVTQKRYIVTEDIDFWEPTAKLLDQATKAKIRSRRAGRVCKYLKKECKITVATSLMALAEL